MFVWRQISKYFLHYAPHLSHCSNHFLSSVMQHVSPLQALTCALRRESAWCSTVNDSNHIHPMSTSFERENALSGLSLPFPWTSCSQCVFSVRVRVFNRTVVKCNIAKSQALYSAQRGLKTNNAAVFKVGAIIINIPQHPATLHSMMVRSSHQLSKQISDLIRQPSNA